MDREAMRYVYGDVDPSAITVNEIHRIISDVAASIANQDVRKDPRFTFTGASYQSKQVEEGMEGLCIEWDPSQAHLEFEPGDRDQVQQVMSEIGHDAIIAAVHANQELFVGVMLGEARQGRDYFKNFIRNG